MRGVRPEEETALREVAERHGQLTTRGPKVGRGDAAWVIEAITAGQIAPILLSDDVVALLGWLVERREGMEYDNPLARGADQLIAALWVAKNKQEGIEHGNQH